MYKTVTLQDFINEFENMGRGEQFSLPALEALYNYLEDIYGPYELDVIELCCEFVEGSIEEALKEHNVEDVDDLDYIWQDGDNVLMYNN